MDEDDEAAPASWAGAVTPDGGVVGEAIVVGGGFQFGFLEACNEDGVGVEEAVYFMVRVLDAVTVELENCAGGGGSRVRQCLSRVMCGGEGGVLGRGRCSRCVYAV